jgi:hypothetical protein
MGGLPLVEARKDAVLAGMTVEANKRVNIATDWHY